MGLTIVPGNMIEDGTVVSADLAVDPRNASNLNSGSVPAAQLGNVPSLNPLKDDVALLGFKAAANGSLAKYDLLDQTVDAFEDASGVDPLASTNEVRDSSGNYYYSTVYGSYSTDSITSTGAGTWTAPASTYQAEILIVAGGGGGGYFQGGGGGGGGVVHDEDYVIVPATVYDVTVGTAGAAATVGGSGSFPHTGSGGGSGGDSVWNVNAEGSGITMTAKGGGGGGSENGSTYGMDAGDGGSGGGTGAYNTTAAVSTQTSPTGAVGYGNAGGKQPSGAYQGMAGGGGAGAVGNDGGTGNGAVGGAGKLFSNFTSYGVSGYFAGGGGGGTYNTGSGGAGGSGGGGASGSSGTANTGGGGGGAHNSSAPIGAGGTGVILIRHRTETYNDMTLVSTSTTAQAEATKGDLVMTYTDAKGTAVINTDIKGYVSRDDGTTYTQGTLTSEGTTSGHEIITFHDLDISGQPSGTSMRYKIETLNQGASKATRIQAVSLGWR